MLRQLTVDLGDTQVTLIDIPASIEDAQDSRYPIRAGPAPHEPYPSTEPKGGKLQQALDAISPIRREYDKARQALLQSALSLLSQHFGYYDLSWCFTRYSRRASVDSATSQYTGNSDSGTQVPFVLSNHENRFGRISELQDTLVVNSSAAQTQVGMRDDIYLIPPASAFVWSTIDRGLGVLQELNVSFDLIVMDPPWTNRSVRRSQEYRTAEHQPEDPFEAAATIVGNHLSPKGLVAVWISNKTAIRDQVLEAMRRLGLELQAEWIWLKVTSAGVPVLPLDGVWRKPFEPVLIFSRQQTIIRQRVIVAVPDVHTRKPSLKRLLDCFLPPGYSAIELFARSLTAGWWALGDEVLKFQHIAEWITQ